jgi:hypothetical protein
LMAERSSGVCTLLRLSRAKAIIRYEGGTYDESDRAVGVGVAAETSRALARL